MHPWANRTSTINTLTFMETFNDPLNRVLPARLEIIKIKRVFHVRTCITKSAWPSCVNGKRWAFRKPWLSTRAS